MKFIKLTYLQYIAYALVTLIAMVFVLVEWKFIIAPIVISFLLSLAIYSTLLKVYKRLKSNILSVVLVTFLFFTSIGLVLYLIIYQFYQFYEEVPDVTQKINSIIVKIEKYLGFKPNKIEQITENKGSQLLEASSDYFITILGDVSTLIMYFTIIPLYVFFFLLFRKKLKQFVYNILKPMHIKVTNLITDTVFLVQEYLKGLLLVMLILAVTNSIGLYILGVPYAIALGFTISLLSIIPYIGTIAGAFLALLVSCITQESLSQLIYISILFSVIQFIEGNFITPKVIGSKININPLVAIIVLIIGEQIWGIIGMIVVLPVTAIVIILIRNLKSKTLIQANS